MVEEWHHLCARALSPSAVSEEPLIYSSPGGNAGAAAPGGEPPPELLGNAGVHGFWRRKALAIFDICVTDTDAGEEGQVGQQRLSSTFASQIQTLEKNDK
jgi:hypothetical protein